MKPSEIEIKVASGSLFDPDYIDTLRERWCREAEKSGEYIASPVKLPVDDRDCGVVLLTHTKLRDHREMYRLTIQGGVVKPVPTSSWKEFGCEWGE